MGGLMAACRLDCAQTDRVTGSDACFWARGEEREGKDEGKKLGANNYDAGRQSWTKRSRQNVEPNFLLR